MQKTVLSIPVAFFLIIFQFQTASLASDNQYSTSAYWLEFSLPKSNNVDPKIWYSLKATDTHHYYGCNKTYCPVPTLIAYSNILTPQNTAYEKLVRSLATLIRKITGAERDIVSVNGPIMGNFKNYKTISYSWYGLINDKMVHRYRKFVITDGTIYSAQSMSADRDYAQKSVDHFLGMLQIGNDSNK